MLPSSLTEKLSLMPGANRDAITVTFRIHPGGDLLAEFEPTVRRTSVRPNAKLSYDQVGECMVDLMGGVGMARMS